MKKYLIENIETTEWYANLEHQLKDAMKPHPNNSMNVWVKDAWYAMMFDTEKKAIDYKDSNNLNYPKFKVTEHLFI